MFFFPFQGFKKSSVLILILLLLLIVHALLPAPLFAKEKKSAKKSEEVKDEKTQITIMNAIKSGNKKDEKNGDELLTFEGNVQISVEKNGSKTIISADRVSYNRERDMLFAEGAVRLEQTEKSGATQTISADSLLFNTATLEGVFDNSRVVKAESNAINLPSGSTITVASDLFARDSAGTIAFKNGELTFCDDENPHWKIKASRIWLLPGNEFAFLNALVYVGPVPVLYLPTFYYPKDELIFNPVFGYKNRPGFYFQTTTYLIGRKPLETSSSEEEDEDDILGDYFSLIKPTKLMDQEREGIILHNLDTEYKGDTTNYLKILLDYYTNIGFSTGFMGKFKGADAVPAVEGGLVFGWSHTVFPGTTSGFYYSFGPSGKSYKDESDFMGMKIPFRYKGGIKVSGSKPFTYSLDLPIYSDPFFNYDFGDRSETMDWFSYLLNNPNQDSSTKTETEKLDAAEITSFSWNSSASWNVPLPDSVKPYISSLSISSFNSAISFAEKSATFSGLSAKQTSDGWAYYTPSRKFFYPSTVTPLKTGLRISGTVYSTTIQRSGGKKADDKLAMELTAPDFAAAENGLYNQGEGQTQGQDGGANAAADAASGAPDSGGSDSGGSLADFDSEAAASSLPDLSFSPQTASSVTPFSYSLTYSVSPDFTSQISYASEPLMTAGDFNFNKLRASYIQVKAPTTLNSSMSFYDNFVGMTNSLTFDQLYQTHPHIEDLKTVDGISNGGYSESAKANLKKTDYAASFMTLYGSNSISIKPFIYYPHFKNTGLSWNTTIKWFRTEFIGDAENPEWDVLTVNWNDENSITSHTLDATFSANELSENFVQTLVLSATLPPQVDRYYGTLTLKFPYITLTAETGVSQVSYTDKTWKKEPFKESFALSILNSKLKFTQSFNYNLEDNYADALKFALSFEGLQVAYTMRYTTTYDFDGDILDAEGKIVTPGTGWKAGDKDFVPYSFSVAYASSGKKFKAWKNRMEFAPGISTSLVYDFVRPTNSYFIFSPSITFRLNKAFYIKFAMTTRNDVIYRYFQKLDGHPGRLPGETNPFIDLINSFRFDDEDLRKSSGFKLKSLELTMAHDLHDWDFNMKFKIEPRLVTPSNGTKYYDFSPYFTLSVVWRPMDSIKTKITDKYGDFVMNGSDTD